MTALLVATTFAVTAAAAARSTWSPCGRSMLSTITPIGERGRGNAYRATTAWFVAGSTVGGLCLGGLGAALAAAAAAGHLGAQGATALAACCATTAAAADAAAGDRRPPGHGRQVNERWLDRFRSGVYGAGFGWQIGTGLATAVMTTGVYLVPVLGACTRSPLLALGAGAAFGLVRGVAVLAGHSIRTPERLTAFHRRLDAWDRPTRRAMVGVEVLAAAALAAAWWAPVAAVPAAVLALATWSWARVARRNQPVCASSQATRSASTSSRLVSLNSSWRPPAYERKVTSATPSAR